MIAFQRMRSAVGRAVSRAFSIKNISLKFISAALLTVIAVGMVCMPHVVEAQTFTYTGAPMRVGNAGRPALCRSGASRQDAPDDRAKKT
jgi:hypothetical protein